MILSKKGCLFMFVVLIAGLGLSGCAAVSKATPTACMVIDVGSIDRHDYTVLDRVEGTSSTTSILLGLIQVIDEDKVKFLGLPLYEEKYAQYSPPALPFLSSARTIDRAYYKALAATPDADTVIQKAYTKELRGLPLLMQSETVTFTGKAIRLKTDAELLNAGLSK